MSEQITLAEFKATHEKERTALQELLPMLETAAVEMGASKEQIQIRHGKSYSSVKYGSTLAFRIKLRGNGRYIEVPAVSRGLVSGIVPPNQQKDITGGFWRVNLQDERIQNYTAELIAVLQDAINRIPKEWDCCSRYRECSDAKKCIHPGSAFALGCGYRKLLASNRIFYGKNRNIT